MKRPRLICSLCRPETRADLKRIGDKCSWCGRELVEFALNPYTAEAAFVPVLLEGWWSVSDAVRIVGDVLDCLPSGPFDLVATDPPYAFGGSGAEHELTATVAVALRESARLVKPGGWMVVFAAASWRSTAYMVESVRGIVEPVRIATWCKPNATSKTRTPGWAWASVNVIAFRNGKSADIAPAGEPDYIECAPDKNGRRAQLPYRVALWAVKPFAIEGGAMLDPFGGTGVLAKAAADCGMRSHYIERDAGAQRQHQIEAFA